MPRSYADMVTGAIHLLVGGADPRAEELLRLAERDPTDTDFKFGLADYAWARYRGLFAHEWAHVSQVASYPYLFLRAARQARMMVGAGVYLEQNPGRYPLPLDLATDPSWADSNVLSDIPVKFAFTEDGIATQAVPGRATGRNTLTELDLIEEDAQLFQYRVEIGSRGNGRAYSRWLIEAPRYNRAFSTLRRHLGEDAAYRALHPLVKVAFRTTRPMLAFAMGLAVLKTDGEVLSEWHLHDLLEAVVARRFAEEAGRVEPSALSAQVPELDDPAGLLPDDALKLLLEMGRQLPVAPLTELHLNGDDEQRGALTRMLDTPWEVFQGRRAPLSDLAENFLPPGIVIRLAAPTFPRGATLVIVSPLLVQTPFLLADPSGPFNYADWFHEVFRSRSLWKTIASGARGANPSCPHTGCRAHATGLCHGWFPVPRRAEDCQFFLFFRSTTKHDVATDGSTLVPCAETL